MQVIHIKTFHLSIIGMKTEALSRDYSLKIPNENVFVELHSIFRLQLFRGCWN